MQGVDVPAVAGEHHVALVGQAHLVHNVVGVSDKEEGVEVFRA